MLHSPLLGSWLKHGEHSQGVSCFQRNLRWEIIFLVAVQLHVNLQHVNNCSEYRSVAAWAALCLSGLSATFLRPYDSLERKESTAVGLVERRYYLYLLPSFLERGIGAGILSWMS